MTQPDEKTKRLSLSKSILALANDVLADMPDEYLDTATDPSLLSIEDRFQDNMYTYFFIKTAYVKTIYKLSFPQKFIVSILQANPTDVILALNRFLSECDDLEFERTMCEVINQLAHDERRLVFDDAPSNVLIGRKLYYSKYFHDVIDIHHSFKDFYDKVYIGNDRIEEYFFKNPDISIYFKIEDDKIKCFRKLKDHLEKGLFLFEYYGLVNFSINMHKRLRRSDNKPVVAKEPSKSKIKKYKDVNPIGIKCKKVSETSLGLFGFGAKKSNLPN